MDGKIYNYKEKGKHLQTNTLNLKNSTNSFKNDIIYLKTSQNADKSAKIKPNKFKQKNKDFFTNYRTLNQFHSNRKKQKEMQLNSKALIFKKKFNINLNTDRYKNKSKQSKIKAKIILTDPNKLKKSNSNYNHKNNTNIIKNKINEKTFNDLPKIITYNIEQKNENNLFGADNEINIEYQKLKKLWEETGVTKSFIKNFEMINNFDINNDNKEEIFQLIKAEINQMSQFKNDIVKAMKLIEKREE